MSLFNVAKEKKMNIPRKLLDLGIEVDSKTGHLFYSSTFKPLELNFELVFVRHGETFGNCGQSTAEGKIDHDLVNSHTKNSANRIFQGDVDKDINQLTATGKDQAVNAAEKLEKEFLDQGWIPDVIFHSPLTRARETAIPFVERNKFHKKFQPLDEIKEMSFGEWENQRVSDMKENDVCHSFYREQHALVKSEGSSENFCEVLLRAYNVLTNLNASHRGQKIVMFSHSMIGAAISILCGKGQKIENGNYLAFDGKKSNNDSYTMPHATPCLLNVPLERNLYRCRN
jgi:broad specificity phosphatase PhoE